MGERALTVRDRIIVHLSGFNRFADEFECPEDMCQSGISVATGKSRAHVTLELNRMKNDGLVSERVAHVKGAKSKRKTYNLTAEGATRSSEIERFLDSLNIKINGLDGPNTMRGTSAVEYLKSNFNERHVIAVDKVLASDGTIDTEEYMARMMLDEQLKTNILDNFPSQNDNPLLLNADQTLDAHVLQANILMKKGESNEAIAILQEAIKNYSSDPGRSKLHYSIASIYRKQGIYPHALKEINRSLSLARDSNDTLMEGRCLMEKAMIFYGTGKTERTMKLLDSAMNNFQKVNSQVDILRCEINMGLGLRENGDILKARNILEEALELAEKTGVERLKAYVLVNLADLLNEQKEFSKSKKMAQNSRDIFQVLDEPLMLALSLFNLGMAQTALGEKKEAFSNMDMAISILEKNELLASRTDWLEKYANILEEMDETEKAQSVLDKM